MTRRVPREVVFVGARLPLDMTSEGVQIGAVDREYNGLAWVASSAAKGSFPIEPLRSGEGARHASLYAVRPDPSDEVEAPRERWVRLSGSEPGDDVYLVGASFLRDDILVPRAALLELIDELLRIRAEHPAPPPPPPPAEPVELEDQLRPYDVSFLRELEAKAQELERLEKESARGEEAGRLRRDLHVGLERAGLLDDGPVAPQRRARVAELGLTRLLSYHEAARKLLTYLRSDERKRYFPEPPLLQVCGAPVSLDWFRLSVPTPERHQPFTWLAFWEQIFARSRTDQPSGEILSHAGNEWHSVKWRSDDLVHPSLVSVEPFEP